MFGVNDKPTLTIFKPQNAEVGYLGIGTDDPKEQVHVMGKLLIESTNSVSSSLQFKHCHVGKGLPPGGGEVPPPPPPYYWDIYSTPEGLNFITISEIAATHRMIITGTGAVGIGVMTPSAKLDVDGLFKASNATIAGNVFASGLFGETATINGVATANTLSAQSATITGTVSANTLSAQSATITNALTAGSATITGALSAPTISGNTYITGNVGIGVNSPQAKLDVAGDFKAQNANITGALSAQNATITGNLSVKNIIMDAISAKSANINGKIKAREVEVTLSGWSDFVFANDYKLLPLSEVAQYIKQNYRLPDIPSATEVEKNGIELGSMQAKLLQKIEELTLYILQQETRMEEMQEQINQLKKQ